MKNKPTPYILENSEQFDLTQTQAEYLLRLGLIYDSGENYFHLSENEDGCVTYHQVELALKGVSL